MRAVKIGLGAMKHIERHHSACTPTQLFDLVADVERYPEFLPWVVAAKVFRRRNDRIWTDMTMGTSLLRKRFTTLALLKRPHRIEVSSDDPMFECFEQIWTFEGTEEGGTHVECQVDIKFRSRVLQTLIGVSFVERAKTMVRAYMREARRLCGVL